MKFTLRQKYLFQMTATEVKEKLAKQKGHPVLDELRSSVLSAASLGIEEPSANKIKVPYHRGGYIRNGVKIIKMYFGPRQENLRRWNAVLIAPLRKWYPSKSANFIFGLDIDPPFLVKIVPEHFNPSVWQHVKDQHTALRVPKDRQEETRQFLKAKKFWFNTKDRRWYPRKLGPVRQAYRHSKYNPEARQFVGGIDAKSEA